MHEEVPKNMREGKRYVKEEMVLMYKHVICIVPKYQEGFLSQICTYEGNFPSVMKTKQLIDLYCLLYASDFQGRSNASRKILGVRKNPPIIVSLSESLVAFPVPIPNYKDLMWIIDFNFECHQISPKLCEIVFENNLTQYVALSEEALKFRKAQACQLLYAVNARHNLKRFFKPEFE